MPKVEQLKPARYLIATSVGLSPGRKDQIKNLFSPYCTSTADIYGKEDLNNLLGQYPEIEKKNFKLWLSSSTVLSRIVHSKIFNSSEAEIERIKGKIKLYVQNDSFFRATKILEELHFCIIAGIPGIGKTTLAEILLIYHLRRGYEPIKITNDISEAYAVLNPTQRQLFYYDDFLGQTTLEDKLNKNEDETLLRFLDTVGRSKTTKLILTTREYILAQAKTTYEKLSASSFDYKKCVVDLEDYTKFHRAKILYNHVYFSNLPLEYLEALLHQRKYMKIVNHSNFNPRIIDWMTNYVESQSIKPENYVANFVASLDNPSRLWQHAFEKQLTNEARHVLLVLVSLPDEVLLEDLECSFASFYGYRSEMHRFAIESKDFRQALKELESNFVRISKYGDNLVVKFHNPSIRDFLTNYIHENGQYAHELIASAIFFEQIVRLWGSSFEGNESEKSRQMLMKMGQDLSNAVRRLLGSKDCRLSEVRRYSGKLFISSKERDTVPLETRAIYALDIAQQLKLSDLNDFVFTALVSNFPIGIHKGALDFLLKQISKKGIAPQKRFLEQVKQLLLKKLDDLDDFESAVEFTGLFPENVSEEERESLREGFESCYQELVDKICSRVSDPDEIRQYAETLKNVGEELDVDVEYEYDLMREQASENEGESQEDDGGAYDSWRDASRELERTEDEIHSMFDGLR